MYLFFKNALTKLNMNSKMYIQKLSMNILIFKNAREKVKPEPCQIFKNAREN